MPTDSDRTREGRVSRDRETIRSWADRHESVPVREPGAEAGERVRFVPERDVGEPHERMEWDAFFTELESGEQVVIYHGETAGEPLEVAERDRAIADVDAEDAEDRLLRGETVTTEVTETAVVESVVVEEMTIESELVDSDVLDQRVVDVELLGREATSCELVATEGVEPGTGFDREAYLSHLDATEPGAGGATATTTQPATDTTTTDTTDTTADTTADTTVETTTDTGGERFEADESFPYEVAVDVEETWTVVRELVEEFTVESRITDVAVTEADSIEDLDVDVQGLHRSIFESGVVTSERDPEEAIAAHDLESDLAADDRIETTVTRERTVEDEIVDRARIRASVTGGERLGMERVHTTPIEAAFEEGEAAAPGEAGAVAGDGVEVDEDLEGKTVVDATGEEIGMVTGIETDRDLLYVDVDPSITERIMTALGWGGADEDDSPLPASAIDRIADDEVVLKEHEHLGERGGGARE